MSGFLLDTNIPSELTRSVSDPRVERWLDNADDQQLYFSVISLGELHKGITILPDGTRRQALEQWLEQTLRPWLAGRILSVNEVIAKRWGVLSGERRLKGKPLGVADGLIAATALVHSLILVTRNVKDFTDLGVSVLNPWEAA